MRLKSSCALSCDTSWRERCGMSCFVGTLARTWRQWREFSTKVYGAHWRSWVWKSSGAWSWALKEAESSSIDARSDSKWMSGALAWELKEAKIHRTSCLLWINKARAKDKIYIWVSVLWKTTSSLFSKKIMALQNKKRLPPFFIDSDWVLISTCKQLVWSNRIGRNMPIWILCCK